MMILLLISLLFLGSIIQGMIYSDEITADIEFIHPAAFMYFFGINSRNYVWDNGDRENRITIGLWLIVIGISFFLYSENIPTEETHKLQETLQP
jgi:hypothetical protein